MKRLLLSFMFITGFCSCASARLAPETPQPTQIEMAVLLNAPVLKPVPQFVTTTVLSILLTPKIVMSYHPIRITCQLPTNFVGEGNYVFGITDMFTSSGPIDRIQFATLINAPCEPFHVFCGYQKHGNKLVVVTSDVIPVGGCR